MHLVWYNICHAVQHMQLYVWHALHWFEPSTTTRWQQSSCVLWGRPVRRARISGNPLLTTMYTMHVT